MPPKRLDTISHPAKKSTPAAEPTESKEAKPVEPTKPEPAKIEEPVAVPAEAPADAKPEDLKPLAEVKTPAETPEAEAAAPEETTPPVDGKAESFDSLFPEPSVVMSGPPGWIWWLLLILGAAGLGFLAFDMYRGKIDDWLSVNSTPTPTAVASVIPTETPTTAATVTPTPTTTATSIDKSTVTLRVLNGTATTGAASTMKTTLEKEGFTVRTIGNAKTQNYSVTTIYYQEGREAEAKLVQTALGSTKTDLQQSTLANPDMVLVVVGGAQ
jgi:outer membrane biosynthesis protein TonB